MSNIKNAVLDLISDLELKHREYCIAVSKLGMMLNASAMGKFASNFITGNEPKILRELRYGLSNPLKFDEDSVVPEMLWHLWKDSDLWSCDIDSAEAIPYDKVQDYGPSWFGVKSNNDRYMKPKFIHNICEITTTDTVYELPFVKYTKYDYGSVTNKNTIFKRFCKLMNSSKPFRDESLPYEEYVGDKKYPEGWYILEVSYLLDVYEYEGSIRVGDNVKKFYTLEYLTEEDDEVTLQDNDWYIPNITEILRLARVEDALRELENENS